MAIFGFFGLFFGGFVVNCAVLVSANDSRRSPEAMASIAANDVDARFELMQLSAVACEVWRSMKSCAPDARLFLSHFCVP